jgi:multiple sugar transport system permease protein
VPAAVVVLAVIIFPWIFTIYVSAHDWHLGGARRWVGFDNYIKLFSDTRFGWAMLRTLFYTVLAVIFPMLLGLAAALAFNRKFPLRGLARTIFILPMMATPVAVALVWTMTFHPQLGVLNWLLGQVGLPPSMWIYSANTVIPTLVMIEVWHWTPLVMLLILGGLASLPIDPYEAAKIDGANGWQAFRHITLPLLMPFIVVALIIRCIDALKAFDTIYVITQGGPGSASETINIFLYLQAFAFYNVGYASAVVVVFFAIILALAALLLWTRQRVKMT